jgi:putative intracellular protease/amidase
MRTLCLLYPGTIEFEVMLACELVHKTFPVEIATPDGSDHQGSNGMIIKAHHSYDDVQIEDYKLVLVPGGNPDSVVELRSLRELLQKSYHHGCIIGAICAGPVLLERAGLLKGRRIAHGYKDRQMTFFKKQGVFADTVLTDEAIIVDGTIVTAKPNAFIDFAVEVARLSGAVEESRSEALKRYYRGKG